MHDIKHRSWGAFGSSVAALGVCMIGAGFLCSVSSGEFQLISIPLAVIGIALAVIGVRVASWDKTEEAKMTPVDRSLTYRFTLVTKGSPRVIDDFAPVKEAFRDLCEKREAWSLTIDPPIGSLSEWKCYYDPKLKFVTEITLNKPEGVQKWGQFCDELVINDLNRLKTVITKKKKVKLCIMGTVDSMYRYRENPKILFLEEYAKELGFKVARTDHGISISSKKLPKAKDIRDILGRLSVKERVFFWNYYHRTISDPGSYISAYCDGGKAVIMEANHGWSSDYKKISKDDLVELILRNWDKDWSREGEFRNAIRIENTMRPDDIRNEMNRVTEIYVPDYNTEHPVTEK
ncbi:MAG: hypothetical protein J5685_10195 [Clostridiales bacterium]|nr:hypothetical protein [Clostridiales bacterium]